MNTRAIATLLVAALAAIGLPAIDSSFAQSRYAWRVGGGPGGQATASIFSINTLSIGSSRVIDYHPVLAISCFPGGEPRWSVSLQLRDSIAAGGEINVSVRLDNGAEQAQRWAVGFQGRSFAREGGGAVTPLLQAKRLRVSWRLGFLAGRGEAIFNLAGVNNAVASLASACGVELPAT